MSSWGWPAEPVPHAADRLDVVGAERIVELAPQPRHVDLDDVAVAVLRVAPRLLEQLGLAHDLAGALEQDGEKARLAPGELDRLRAPPAPPQHRVEPQIAVHPPVPGPRLAAAHPGA